MNTHKIYNRYNIEKYHFVSEHNESYTVVTLA